MLNRSKIIIVSVVALTLSGCTFIYNPATQRKEITFIDTRQEIILGRNMDMQVKRKFKLIDDVEMEKRLNSIAYKIAAASHRQDLIYRFKIINDKELNAFALPGGFVYVHNGLIQAATDDELACVLGHEIGHIAARHSVKKLETAIGYNLAMSIALSLIDKNTAMQIMSQAVDQFFTVGSLYYSRKDELLADKLSVRYAKKAGFNPRAMITFFEKLKKESERRGPKIKIYLLSSHPAIEERINNIESEITLSRE